MVSALRCLHDQMARRCALMYSCNVPAERGGLKLYRHIQVDCVWIAGVLARQGSTCAAPGLQLLGRHQGQRPLRHAGTGAASAHAAHSAIAAQQCAHVCSKACGLQQAMIVAQVVRGQSHGKSLCCGEHLK